MHLCTYLGVYIGTTTIPYLLTFRTYPLTRVRELGLDTSCKHQTQTNFTTIGADSSLWTRKSWNRTLQSCVSGPSVSCRLWLGYDSSSLLQAMNQLPVLKQENKQDHQPATNLLIPVKQMETEQSYKVLPKKSALPVALCNRFCLPGLIDKITQ
jgi:hypothetical protein